jgi:ADP-heptose:LPS heptosyltransferase
MERWEKVIASRPDIPFFQIGAQTDHKLLGADHRLMGTDLNVSIALMAHASLHLGIDSWTNHLTNIEWVPRGFVPSIILWGSTQAAAAGYPRNTNISLGLHCQPCFREDPKISRMPRGPCINPPGQDYDKPHHACMAGISVDLVLADIEKLLPSK